MRIIAELLPTKKQFEDWSLPAKATYIAFLICVCAFVLMVLFFVIQIMTGASKEGQQTTHKNQEKAQFDRDQKHFKIMATLSNVSTNFYDLNDKKIPGFTEIKVLDYKIVSAQKGYMKIKITKDYLNTQFDKMTTLKYQSGNYEPVMITFKNNAKHGPGIIFISQDANKRIEIFWNQVFGAGSRKLIFMQDLYFDLYFNDFCLYVIFPSGGEATIQGNSRIIVRYAKDLTVNSIYNDSKGRNATYELKQLKEYFDIE